MRRIQVSENKRFLVYEDGTPFFWLGDTAWELFHRTRLEEAGYYLENRRQKGFNIIQAVILAESDGLHVPNAYGDRPLHNDDPTRPNEAYFRYVDSVIDLAAQKGLYIGLLPTWGDKVNLMWGVGPVIFDDENARTYGEFLGARYADRTNVIWIIGGDRPEQSPDGTDYSSVWRAMISGIQNAAGGNAFFTYHPMGQHSSAMGFHDEDWLQMNMWQSGHLARDIPNWEWIAQDYGRTPVKPVLDGEPAYEDHPIDPFTRKWVSEYGRFRAHDVRKQAYRAVFAGACGHTYGHHSVWQMYSSDRAPINFPDLFWVQALDRPGACQMIHLRRLLEAWPYLTRIPDQALLVSDAEEGLYHIQATRASDGSYALVYIPTGDQTVRIDMSKFAGSSVRIQWFDPRCGTITPVGKIHGAAMAEFTTPQEGPDWVLMLDCVG